MTGTDDSIQITNSRTVFIGLRCKITIRKGEHTLFYTGTIKSCDNIGITFLDKYNNLVNSIHSEVVNLEQIQENKWFGEK